MAQMGGWTVTRLSEQQSQPPSSPGLGGIR
jgi:hypothetical protein